jgi:hypothetical protein
MVTYIRFVWKLVQFRRVQSIAKPSTWGYNQVTLFLGDIITGTWPSRLGSLESETVKCGHESRGTRT